ncbi:MAG TPA: hypothetical protein VHI31_00515, partial [Actinomycetota bacterium]|nr:hypothetical protein [Actinomycetota bacterium]
MNRLLEVRQRLGDVVQAPFEVSQLPGVQYTDLPGDAAGAEQARVARRVGVLNAGQLRDLERRL